MNDFENFIQVFDKAKVNYTTSRDDSIGNKFVIHIYSDIKSQPLLATFYFDESKNLMLTL